MPNLSFTAKRIIVGIGLFFFLFSIANNYFGFGPLGNYRKGMLAATGVILALLLHFVGPTIQEMREYRDMKRNKQQ